MDGPAFYWDSDLCFDSDIPGRSSFFSHSLLDFLVFLGHSRVKGSGSPTALILSAH